MNRLSVFAFIVGMVCVSKAEDLSVLTAGALANSPAVMFEDHLNAQAFAALDRRQAGYEKIETPEEIREYQARVKKFFV